MTTSTALPLFRRSLGDSWRSLIGWSLGLLAALLLYLPLFPSIGGSEQMQTLIDSLPSQLVDALGYGAISTGPGYTQSTFYGLMGFLLLSIAAVSWGTAAIAGEEESGSLELTLAHGVTRTQVVLERSAAVAVRLLWLSAFSAAVIALLNSPSQLDISTGNLIACAAAMLGLALVGSTAAIAVGALTGRRIYATAAGAGILVVSYALNAVANQSSDLSALRDFSAYGWAYGHSPLINGVDAGGLWLLYGLSAVFVGVGVVALRTRDITG